MTNENSTNSHSLSSFEGERSLPNVNTARRSKNNGLATIFGFFAVIFMLIFGYFSFFTNKKAPPPPEPPPLIKVGKIEPLRIESLPEPVPDTPPPPPVIEQPQEVVLDIPKPPPVLIDHSRSSLMIFTNDKKKETASSPSRKDSNTNYGIDKPTILGDKMAPTSTVTVSAAKIQHPNLTLTKGTVINCSLQTRIDTSVPGFVSCITTRDVYSDTGRILLIERGSQIVGEYQNNVENGLNRIFVLWTRVKTPNGVVVDINSPGADALGGAGVEGYVNNRFWQRFGTAMLLSVVDQGISLGTDLARIKMSNRENRRNNSDSNGPSVSGSYNKDDGARLNFDLGSATSPMTDIVNSILEKQANIPDTMIKNQGGNISIFVARDLDFSTVYDVKPY